MYVVLKSIVMDKWQKLALIEPEVNSFGLGCCKLLNSENIFLKYILKVIQLIYHE